MEKEKIDRLAQENAAALAAGMSYGKWKAKQPVKPIEAPAVAETPKYRHVCEYCGEEFFIKSKRLQKYCCEECREAAERQRAMERKSNKTYQHVCEYCGKAFFTNENRNQKYCSAECRISAHRQQMREHHAQERIRSRMNKQLQKVVANEQD